jgi:hypothetical protein
MYEPIHPIVRRFELRNGTPQALTAAFCIFCRDGSIVPVGNAPAFVGGERYRLHVALQEQRTSGRPASYHVSAWLEDHLDRVVGSTRVEVFVSESLETAATVAHGVILQAGYSPPNVPQQVRDLVQDLGLALV